MKLQSQISRKYGKTEYRKYWIVIPSELLNTLGWKTGQKLQAETKDDKLIIKKL